MTARHRRGRRDPGRNDGVPAIREALGLLGVEAGVIRMGCVEIVER
jgi:hypothetical protein